MFIDKAIIHIKAGGGGNGAVSFHREKYVAAGGPDGGDGGRGGNVVFVAQDGTNTLSDFRYKRKFTAPSGEPGGKKRCFGKAGEDLIVPVPRGTLLYDNQTGRLMADMSGDEPFVAAKGGRGGWGNAHFATPTRQVPRFAKPGVPGEEYELRLELKLLADVGLVGFPNVGKSTLISVVSEAKPQIANYHFTTITPVLGVVRVQEGTSFVMADIPGLIEGAGEGAGLGHDFLRHVERCRLLVHVVDVSGSEGRDPLEDFDTINSELEKFSKALSETILDSFLLRKNQLVGLAIRIKDANANALTNEGVQTLKNFFLVGTTNTWVVLSRKLRNWQEATNTFVFYEQTTAVSIIRLNLDNFTGFELGGDFIPTLLFNGFAER
jgi:GTP-binding protein